MPQTAKKALKLTTEIDIHAVSCPGVWLPGRGRCSLSVCLLGFHTRTNKLPPVFPLLYHEKFKFERTFVGVRNLSVLEKVLEAETVYLELVQEETSGEAVLAVFESSVRDLLFPKPAEKLSYSGVDLDLLMEPTRDFPGIISPKIEVSTRTSVSETRTPLHQCSQDNVSFGHAHNRNTKAMYRSSSPEEGRKGDGGGVGGGGGGGGGGGTNEGVAGAIVGANHEDEVDDPLPVQNSPRRGESSRGGARDDGPKPRFGYRRPDDDLLSRIPSSPTRNTRYLGIPSRYLSRSAGNLADMPRTSLSSRYGRQHGGSSGGGNGKTSSETDGGRYTHPRRRPKDDFAHHAHVSLLDPKRCPHCDGEHGAESCTTCRTYHRYFPRPPRPRSHAHAYHANNPHAVLKVLRQPAHRELRPRKRYLAEIDGYMYGDRGHPSRRARSLSPQRRPTSAPPDRPDSTSVHPDRGELNSDHLRKDVDDLSGDEDNESKSPSRSPSPPASHASAPAAISHRRPRSYRRPLTPSTRRRYYDSDEDSGDDLYVPRRYYRHHYYPWEDCPLCYPDYPYLPRYPRLSRYERYRYFHRATGCRCSCSTCSRYYSTCHYLGRPLNSYYRYRPSCLPYYPYRSSYKPYSKSYLRHLEMLDSDDLNPSPPLKLPKATKKAGEIKDATSEDSDLFDSSQVEEIEEGMSKKSRLTKRENWLKTDTGAKDASRGVNEGEAGRSQSHVTIHEENESKKVEDSSGEFFNID
ncbi:uncharacterized protein LOC121877022 isoform X2 [Homarus americanus]|uniref:uncharacterized protein LOC121877022 isoform X2 n=1 Tax=Homarus americanus TaxID=6706 RepID=UPI001C4590A3|nr:uncharacterized protein LOC121877022 isoform X2 [Homarus americanus]